MEKIIVGIADSHEQVHNIIDKYVYKENNLIELIHFFDVQGILEFLDDNPEGLDMLFLDIVFEGSMFGTDGIPYIKELSPKLPIILHSGNELDDSKMDELIKTKQINDYMEKPTSKEAFLNKIHSIKTVL